MAIIISQSTKIVKLYMRRLEKGNNAWRRALSCPSYSDEYVFISCSEYHIDLSPGFLHFYLVEYYIGIAE